MVDDADNWATNKPCCSRNRAIYTGNVADGFPVILKERKNSFQICTAIFKPALMIPIRANGIAKMIICCQREHPSIRAASKISFGKSLKNECTSHTARGILKPTYARSKPRGLFFKFSFWYVMNKGINTATGGNRIVVMNQR